MGRIFTFLLLSSVLAFPSFSSATTCEENGFPILHSKKLKHALTYKLPALYFKNGNATPHVSLEDAISYISTINSDKPSVLGATKHVIQSLELIAKTDLREEINAEELAEIPEFVEGETLNIFVHAYLFYSLIQEWALLNEKAVVKINGKTITNSNTQYKSGIDKTIEPGTGASKMHVYEIISSDTTIFRKCWYDDNI